MNFLNQKFNLKKYMTKQSVGAFWKKTSSSGLEYLSGSIESEGEKKYIVVFKNTKKNKETQPDYQVYLSEKNDK